jgi:hypothetical protein
MGLPAVHQISTSRLAGAHEQSKDKAGRRIRTDDLLITNQLLYQLSYAGNNGRSVAQRRLRDKRAPLIFASETQNYLLLSQ